MSDTIAPPTSGAEAPARRLVRVDDGRWLGGVAAGLGRYFDVNPLIYRIAFAALAFAGGTGILLYVAAWLVMPSETREESIAVDALREHRERPWLVLGVGLLLFGALLAVAEADFWTGFGNVWLAAVLAGTALLWWQLAHRGARPGRVEHAAAEAPRPPRKPSLLAPVLGALLVAAGAFGLLSVLDVYTIDLELALALSVAAVGGAVVLGALTGRRAGWLVVLGLVLLAGFGVAASTPVPISSGVGDKVERPLTATGLAASYEYGVGAYTLDLTDVELPPGETSVAVSLGIGELIVEVPEGTAVEVDAHAGLGDLNVLGTMDDGVSVDRVVQAPGEDADAPLLVLDARVGIGSVEVRRG